MPRRKFGLAAVLLVLAACGGSGESDATVAATGTTVAERPFATTAAPTTPTISAPTTIAPVPTSMTPVGDLKEGMFCRDLAAIGYDYAEAVTYWTREGRPDRMDADRNGIPCETVYPSAEVLAFWGDPLPTSTLPSFTMAGLEADVHDQWRAASGSETDWSCQIEAGGSLTAGAVVSCAPSVIGEGEHAVLTVLVLDDAGTTAVAEAGVRYPDLNAGFIVEAIGTGKLCRDVLDIEAGLSEWMEDPELRYFGAVLYWFMEGRPDRMDADTNGIPCETLVSPEVVAGLWGGGYVGEI